MLSDLVICTKKQTKELKSHCNPVARMKTGLFHGRFVQDLGQPLRSTAPLNS